jgi:predicted regulator of Ras-like GTPase activity (Roadblock/LC7/MglB family)
MQLEHLTYKEIWQRLKQGGCPLHLQTIRHWLDDDDIIAPRQYERDVPIIAQVTGDPQLNNQIQMVLAMINNVFGAHQRASNALAQQVLERAVLILKEENRQSKLFEIEHDIVLVRVAEIDQSYTQVRLSIANRLQEPDQ